MLIAQGRTAMQQNRQHQKPTRVRPMPVARAQVDPAHPCAPGYRQRAGGRAARHLVDQWMLQAKASARPEGVDGTAGLALLIPPCVPRATISRVCLAWLETMHDNKRGRRNGELSSIETVEQAALAVLAYREPNSHSVAEKWASPYPELTFP